MKMDTSQKALIMLFHLYANGACLKRANFEQRYLSFFNARIDHRSSDDCISLLVKNRLAVLDNGCLIPTEEGREIGNRNQARYYFSDGIKASQMSAADKKYKEGSNGIVKCDSLIDAEQLDFIVAALAGCRRAIWDLGCGTGELTAYIQRHTRAEVRGIDSSPEMIDIARKAYPHMNWRMGEIEAYNDTLEIDAFLLIDSFYFVKEKAAVISRLFKKIRCGGKIVLTYSNYVGKKQAVDRLAPQNNDIGKIIDSYSMNTESKDFTKNEIALWSSRLKLLESLRSQYLRENSEYLYYDKKTEGDRLLCLLKRGLGKRYIYVITKNCTSQKTTAEEAAANDHLTG